MLTDVAAAQAMIANARWAERLGWDRYVDAIAVLVSSTSTEPGAHRRRDQDDVLRAPEAGELVRGGVRRDPAARAAGADQVVGRHLQLPRDPRHDVAHLAARVRRRHRPERVDQSAGRQRRYAAGDRRRVRALQLLLGRQLQRAHGSDALPIRARVLTPSDRNRSTL